MSDRLAPIEEKMIQYIRDNPGNSKSDLVRFINDLQMGSRIATLAHIDKLENRKMIICKLERPNSQIYKIYINEDNKLATVLGELEEFKDAYINLLEKSKEKINSKDYSTDAKALGIKEMDPSKWEESEKLAYLKLELTRMENSLQNDKDDQTKIHELFSAIQSKIFVKSFTGEEYSDLKDHKIKIGRAVMKMTEEFISGKDSHFDKEKILTIRSMYSKLNSRFESDIETLKNLRNYEVMFLTINAIYFFRVLTDIMFYRSTIKWPKFVQREEILHLYSIVQSKIVEIQLQLLMFFESLKIGFVGSDPTQYISIVKSSIKERDLSFYLAAYQIFGMQQEIEKVIDSLSSLNEEIKDFKLLERSHTFGTLDTLEGYKVLIGQLLKEIDIAISH